MHNAIIRSPESSLILFIKQPFASQLYFHLMIAIKMAVSSIALHFHHSPSTKFPVNRKRIHAKGEQTASFVTEKQEIKKKVPKGDGFIGSRVASLLEKLRRAPLEVLKPPDTDIRSWPLLAEIAVDKAIINCRFFALIAVVGSLVGSILCFVEGCFLVLESCVEHFHIISHSSEHGRMVQMVIEAIGMFLVGTAMLSFGMGLYSMFIGSRRTSGLLAHGSNPFARFHLKMLSDASSTTNSISKAKSRIGHVVVMLLQAGLMEKFKNVPLTTGLDLACFAGVLLFSSASMFLLSQLHCSSEEDVTVGQSSPIVILERNFSEKRHDMRVS